MASGEFGCRTELFTPVSHLTHSTLSTPYPPSCNFRRDVTESGGCSSRRVPDTLERLLKESRGTDTRPFVARSVDSECVRTTWYILGVLIQRDENLNRSFLVGNPFYVSQSDPFARSSRQCRELQTCVGSFMELSSDELNGKLFQEQHQSTKEERKQEPAKQTDYLLRIIAGPI